MYFNFKGSTSSFTMSFPKRGSMDNPGFRGGHGADIRNFKDIRDPIRVLRIFDFSIRSDP